MKKFSNEIKIGIIVFSGLLMLVWGINYLKGIRIFSTQLKLYAVYNAVDGLNEANPVQINGLKVGLVREVKFMPNNTGKILVTFLINPDLQIPNNTVAKIISSDIMGSKAVDFKIGNSSKFVNDGDTLPSEVQLSLSDEVNRQVAPIKAKAESLIGSMDSVMNVIQGIFNPEARENLSKSIDRISKALLSLEHASSGIDTIVNTEKGRFKDIFANIESISRNIKNNNEKISEAIQNISSITDTIAQADLANTIKKTKKVIEELGGVIEKINRGEGSLGMLVNNDSLYVNLNSTARDLDLLVKDLNANPHRYVHFSVFGKKDKKTLK